MNFSEAFGLMPDDTIAIIGSSGKTSLCYRLAKENDDKKLALTTTTKVFIVKPEYLHVKNFYDFYGKDLPNSLQNGVNVFGKFYKEKKISSLNPKEFEKLQNISDMLIYEADGSKQKPLKAWDEHEPVILKNTDVVIGIIPIDFLGKKVDEKFIHRFEIFCEKFKVNDGNKINENLFIKIIEEMFKKVPSNAKKILFLNYFDDLHEKSAHNIAKNFLHVKTFAGSIKDKIIKKIK